MCAGLATHVAIDGAPIATQTGATTRLLFRSDPDVQGRRKDSRPACVSALADHPVQDTDHVCPLLLSEIGEKLTGNRIAADGPVPQLLTRTHLDALFMRRVDGHAPQTGIAQPTSQLGRIGDLEFEHRFVVGRSLEVGDDRLDRPEEEVERLEVLGVPV